MKSSRSESSLWAKCSWRLVGDDTWKLVPFRIYLPLRTWPTLMCVCKWIWLMGAMGNIVTFIRSPSQSIPAPPLTTSGLTISIPKPLLATPTCTSSILCVIVATLLAIGRVSRDTKTWKWWMDFSGQEAAMVEETPHPLAHLSDPFFTFFPPLPRLSVVCPSWVSMSRTIMLHK